MNNLVALKGADWLSGVRLQFTWSWEPDSGLDLPGGDGGPLVVVG